ncbi:MAG: hypothetical protein ACREKK_07590, partial [Candidatus Methylomirabilales bacterium]
LGIDPDKPLNGGFLRASRRPDQWLDRGARDEDDTLSTNFARYRNHFYDPVNNRGLDATGPLGLPIRGERAPDWALEDRQEFSTQNFSYRDARQAFFTALTEGAPGDREAALARTFEMLGHIIHLVQDMASPPHTRNDMHGGFGFGAESLYERYLNDPRVRRRLNFNGTPVRFDLPRHYWTTADGRGLADFVNRNFVSEGTNFRARVDGAIGGGYPSPVLRLGVDEQGRPFETTLDTQTQLEPGLRDTNGNLIEGGVTFFANNFQDPITGQPLRNERMTTLSLFDRELERRGESLVLTLNRYNVEAQAAFLIPRAVGYSAGVLEYFFRGRLQASFAPGPNGGREVILQTQNVTDEPIGPGTLLLFYDDDSGERHLIQKQAVQDLGEVTELPALRFDVPAGPLSQYVVVYRGQLGQEADAVVGRVLGGLPIVAVQELAALTGAEFEEFTPSLGGGGGWVRQKDPNQQRAAGSFWAGTAAGVGRKIREVRLEEDDGLFGTPPQAVLRLNGREVGTEWRAAEDPGLLPEDWEVVLTPIPAKTLATGVKPPPALWVNGFRTPLLWIERVIASTGQATFTRDDGIPVWITTRGQRTGFYFGDGVRGLDPQRGTPLTTPRTGVSFRPVGEAAGGPVPRAEFEFLLGDCLVGNPLFRFRFVFAVRSTNVFFGGCEVGSDVRWGKNFLWLQERVLTLGAQPDPAVPPLVTAATFRREFLDADLERFLSVGIVPLEYDIQTQ